MELVVVVLQTRERPRRPIAMHVEDVATPAATVDGFHELLLPRIAAVVRRRRAESLARAHGVLPIAQHLAHGGRGVVSGVGGLVVGLHVR